MSRISLVTAAALSAALGLTALGFGPAGIDSPAQAQPGVYSWCPGQPLPMHGLGWDMNVCHTYQTVPFGAGNVPMFDVNGNPMDSYLWMDSPPPPLPPRDPAPPPPRPAHCPPWNVIIGPSECGGL
jgi:hypothetical protein